MKGSTEDGITLKKGPSAGTKIGKLLHKLSDDDESDWRVMLLQQQGINLILINLGCKALTSTYTYLSNLLKVRPLSNGGEYVDLHSHL